MKQLLFFLFLFTSFWSLSQPGKGQNLSVRHCYEQPDPISCIEEIVDVANKYLINNPDHSQAKPWHKRAQCYMALSELYTKKGEGLKGFEYLRKVPKEVEVALTKTAAKKEELNELRDRALMIERQACYHLYSQDTTLFNELNCRPLFPELDNPDTTHVVKDTAVVFTPPAPIVEKRKTGVVTKEDITNLPARSVQNVAPNVAPKVRIRRGQLSRVFVSGPSSMWYGNIKINHRAKKTIDDDHYLFLNKDGTVTQKLSTWAARHGTWKVRKDSLFITYKKKSHGKKKVLLSKFTIEHYIIHDQHTIRKIGVYDLVRKYKKRDVIGFFEYAAKGGENHSTLMRLDGSVLATKPGRDERRTIQINRGGTAIYHIENKNKTDTGTWTLSGDTLTLHHMRVEYETTEVIYKPVTCLISGNKLIAGYTYYRREKALATKEWEERTK